MTTLDNLPLRYIIFVVKLCEIDPLRSNPYVAANHQIETFHVKHVMAGLTVRPVTVLIRRQDCLSGGVNCLNFSDICNIFWLMVYI